jgi:hypothetical protein
VLHAWFGTNFSIVPVAVVALIVFACLWQSRRVFFAGDPFLRRLYQFSWIAIAAGYCVLMATDSLSSSRKVIQTFAELAIAAGGLAVIHMGLRLLVGEHIYRLEYRLMRRLLNLCAATTIVLLALSLLLRWLNFNLATDFDPYHFWQFIDFREEANLPNTYSFILLLLVSLILLLISTQYHSLGRRGAARWAILSAIFLFMSIDEATQVKERLVASTARLTDASAGFLSSRWLPLYGLLLVIFVIAYIPFLLQLPRRTALLFIFSGIIYVTAAFGFELLEGHFRFSGGQGWLAVLFDTVEEAMETVGLIIFLYTLLWYLRSLTETITFRVVDGKDPAT